MNQKQVFTIGSPCHEDWNKMTAVEQGRFCDVCAKCVVDLSGKSQSEIKNLFEVHEGQLCGSMPVSQYQEQQAMVRPEAQSVLVSDTQVPSNWLGRSLKPIQIFAAALVLAFGLGTTVQAQGHMKVGKMVRHVASGSVNGTVWNEGAGVPGVTVVAEHNGSIRQTTTDAEGKYSFARLGLGAWNLHVEVEGERKVQSVKIEEGQNKEAWFHFNEYFLLGDIAPLETEVETIEYTEQNTTRGEIKAIPIQEEEEQVVMEIELAPVPMHEVLEQADCRLREKELETVEISMVSGLISIEEEEVVEVEIEIEEEIWDGPDFTGDGATISSLQAGEATENLVKVTVHPVPTQDVFTIRIAQGISDRPLELLLFDVGGKLLQTGDIEGSTGSTAKMNISHLPAGVYFLKGLSETYVFDQKILKL